MIKKAEFTKLSKSQQEKFTLQYGDFIAKRPYYSYVLKLYKIGQFFVELWYSPHSERCVKLEFISDNKYINNKYLKRIFRPKP